MKNETLVGTALLTIVSVLAMGCGTSAASLCDQACDCTGCSDSQYNDCIDFAEDAELDAEQNDCSGEYDELLSCYDANFECVNDVPTYNGCAGELVNLAECVGGQTDG